VKKLIITHHDPDHDDDFLDSMEKDCQEIFPNSEFAKEGMEILV
jgi:phosphoribosyl 1,2-cyclic phosphodiesterase